MTIKAERCCAGTSCARINGTARTNHQQETRFEERVAALIILYGYLLARTSTVSRPGTIIAIRFGDHPEDSGTNCWSLPILDEQFAIDPSFGSSKMTTCDSRGFVPVCGLWKACSDNTINTPSINCESPRPACRKFSRIAPRLVCNQYQHILMQTVTK